MRETMLVGGKLSSRSPHYEGSERDDSVKVVKRGLDHFWWRKLKQRHDGCLMSWKWRYRDHPCRSQNLPQNICNYYINELIFELSSWWQRAKQLGPDEADEDQTGTNKLELCFALPTHISPVRRWDRLLLRKLNPRQTAALDHYKSHPQIFVAICNLKIIKPFYYYLLQKSELYFFCFLFYNIYPSDSSLQLPVHPLPFRRGHRPFF